MKKIIIVKRDVHTAKESWPRTVCNEDDYSVKMQKDGWFETQNREYLNEQQLEYLGTPEPKINKPVPREDLFAHSIYSIAPAIAYGGLMFAFAHNDSDRFMAMMTVLTVSIFAYASMWILLYKIKKFELNGDNT